MTAVENGAARSAEQALSRHGWDGDRLIREARTITNAYARANIPYLAPHRRDDLVDFVVEKALVAAKRFDPDRQTTTYGSNGGRHFDSWICDVMTHRCTDWLRSKSEGNGDARYGHDNRVVLDDTLGDAPDPDVDFAQLVSERRLLEWEEAARLVELPMAEFIVVTLDRASRVIRRQASESANASAGTN